jgi:transposase, IS30 family
VGHLSYDERAVITQYRFQDSLSIREISRRMGRDHSVISRELRRNGSKTVQYNPTTAHQRAKTRLRKRQNNHCKLTKTQLLAFCDYMWDTKMTVDQTSMFFETIGVATMSRSRMYEMIRQDRKNGGELWQVLDRPGKMKQFPTQHRAHWIEDGRKRITERPFIPEDISELGHWEVDTVHSKGHRGGVVTIVERKSLFYIAIKVKDLKADTVCKTIIRALKGFKVLTITSDNGSEFAEWKMVEEGLNCGFYFARPYKSNDRARNERMNRELRRLYPKGTDFDFVTEQQLAKVLHNINNVPRRRLKKISSTQAYAMAA